MSCRLILSARARQTSAEMEAESRCRSTERPSSRATDTFMGSFDFAACQWGGGEGGFDKENQRTAMKPASYLLPVNDKEDVSGHLYLQLYPTGRLLPFTVDSHATQEFRTI